MPPKPEQPNPFAETNTLLEHILENQDDNAKHTITLLENLLEQEAKEDHTPNLLENNLELQSKIVEKLDELKNQTWEIELNLQ